MAVQCDSPKCDKTEGVERVTIAVISGQSTQATGDFCTDCRKEIPKQLEAVGFRLSDGRNPARRHLQPVKIDGEITGKADPSLVARNDKTDIQHKKP